MLPLKQYVRNPRLIGKAVLKRFFWWLPDRIYVELLYYFEMGYWLDLKNPKTFNEKLQWLKLYDRKPEYTTMVDKYAVKDYVAGLIGEQYIIPTLGVWDSFDDIDFGSLPDKFVLKTTHGGGGGGVVICRDKAHFDRASAKEKLEQSMKSDIYRGLREWPYKNVPKRIIAEKLLETENNDVNDYKFFTFDGKVKFLKVDFNRFTHHQANYFDPDFNPLEFGEVLCPPDADHTFPMPKNYDKMVEIVQELTKHFHFVRCDLYNINGEIYFGELTFYPASGLGSFDPKAYDEKLGKIMTLPNRGGYLIDNQNITLRITPVVKKQENIDDYKFYCFDGEAKYVMVCKGRESGVHFYFFDKDWKLCRINVEGINAPENFTLPKPKNIDKMFEIASRLSKGIPHLRVDLYNVDGDIYFGELTFFTASGFDNGLLPDTDRLFGNLIKTQE